MAQARSSTTGQCGHLDPTHPLYKKTIVVREWSKYGENWVGDIKKVETKGRACDLCRTIFLSREAYIEGWSTTLWQRTVYCILAFFTATGSGDESFKVELMHIWIGEAYHVLVCCLLLVQSESQTKVRIDFKVDWDCRDRGTLETPEHAKHLQDLADLKDLFKWYDIAAEPAGTKFLKKSNADSKKSTTGIVAAVFKRANEYGARTIKMSRADQASNNSETAVPVESKRAVEANQPSIFDRLAEQLNLKIWLEHCDGKKPKVDKKGDLMQRGSCAILQYISPTWAAKYWLNRYGTNECEPWKAGDLLWQQVDNPDGDRVRQLASVMNTIIPVEVLQRAHAVVNTSRDTKQQESQRKGNGTEKEITIPREEDDIILRVEPGFENELAAALFMFMCCDLQPGPAPMDPGDYRRDNPAWTGRVDLMNDICAVQGNSSGDWRGQHTFQTGQEWLRRRYDFAVKAIDGIDDEVPADLMVTLTPWDGIDEKWSCKPAYIDAMRLPTAEGVEVRAGKPAYINKLVRWWRRNRDRALSTFGLDEGEN